MEVSKYTGFPAGGRGLINGTDLGVIVAASKASATYFGTDSYGKIRRMAANLALVSNANLHNMVNASDIAAFLAGTAGGAYVNQVALATNHTAYPYSAYA